MVKYIFKTLSLLFALSLALPAQAAVLNTTQLDSVSSLLSSFSTNAASIAQVRSALLGASTTVPAIPVDVFLVAGQSNAAGVGDASQSPVPPVGKVLQYCNNKIYDASDPVCGASTGSAWPSFGITYNTSTGRYIAFVPTALGGTGMAAAADTGLGNWDTSGTLYASSVTTLNAALAAFKAAGYTSSFRGILWSQGEADAFAINAGLMTVATYKAAFTNMLSRYRAQYGSTMPFYIFRTGTQTNGSDAGYAQVRQAQEDFAVTLPNVYMVWRGASDYPARGLMKDVWHYTQAGYNEMGQLGAQAVVAAQATQAPPSANQQTQTYSTPGTYSFTVPAGMQGLTVTVLGGSGPAVGCLGVYSSATPQYGTAGGASSFNGTLIANGGSNNGSTAGTASGGDTNSPGGANNAPSSPYPGCDGLSHTITSHGGKAVKAYAQGTLPAGTIIPVVVGAGGTAKSGGTFDGQSGNSGSVSLVYTVSTGTTTASSTTSVPPPPPVSSPTSTPVSDSKSYTTPGTYTFTVPQGLQSLTVTVNGGGGPGVGCIGVYGAATPEYGTAGGQSSFNGTVIGGGGAADGTTPGSASGGDTNSPGGAGNAASFSTYPGCDGLAHGISSHGGRAIKSYTSATLTPGSSVTVVVGAGGVGKGGGTFDAPSGNSGSVLISYTTLASAGRSINLAGVVGAGVDAIGSLFSWFKGLLGL